MLDRSGETTPALWNTFACRPKQTTLYVACSKESPEQGQETRIMDPFAYTSHQQLMMDLVEVAGEVALDYPATNSIGTILQLKPHGADRVVHTTFRSEPIRETMKVALPDGVHCHEHGTLHKTVAQRRSPAAGQKEVALYCVDFWLNHRNQTAPPPHGVASSFMLVTGQRR